MSKRFFKKHYTLVRIIEVALDLFFIVLSFLLIIQLDGYVHSGDFIKTVKELFSNFLSTYYYVFRTQLLYIFTILFFFIVYQVSAIRKSYTQTMVDAIIALGLSNMIVIVISVLLSKSFARPELIIYTFLLQVLLFGVYKFVLHKIVSKIDKRKVMIVAKEEEAKLIATKFLMDRDSRRYIKYILFEEKMGNGEIDKLICFLDKVDDVIIGQGLSENIKNNIMTYCLSKMYKDVYLIPKLYEISIVNSKMEQIRDTPVFVSQSLHLTITQRFLKRTLDISLSIIGLVLLSPLLLVVSLLIKLNDKGPVFYKQERITRGNKPFMLIKFRTMIVDAEKETGAVWQMENDPRITKIGKFLRATRIDELPQLYNVLKGEMTLIGPRPEREIFIQQFIQSIPDFKYRVNVKPGITGLAQVLGKYNSEPIDKLRFDLIYIRNYSLLLDIKILLLTIKAVLSKDSSATLGIPKFEEIIEDKKLVTEPMILGLEFKKREVK